MKAMLLTKLKSVVAVTVAVVVTVGIGVGLATHGAPAGRQAEGDKGEAVAPRKQVARAEAVQDEPQAVYAANHDDPWNRIFACLFTSTITARLSDRFGEVVERIEHGDRAIEPLYPSSVGGSTTRRDGAYQVMTEPLSSRFKKALEDALNERGQRSPLARALMQADLWAAHDLLFRNYEFDGDEGKRRLARRDELLRLLAHLIKKVALTPGEIKTLPDNYAAGAGAHHLPDLFGRDSAWCEVRWLKERIHDSAADYRRVARVFLKPAAPRMDRLRFVNQLRRSDNPSEQLDAAALVTQNLLIDSDGKVTVSPLTYEVQVRTFVKDRNRKLVRTEARQYELNRQKLLHAPRRGGFVETDDRAAVYLPSAGNDYSFASNQLDSEPIRVRLETRCAACHGEAGVMTFNRHEPTPIPPVTLLGPSENEHARYVIGRKAERKDFKALQERWK
jgi:hypothetical protein